jgi:hypothetical protein
MNANTTVGFEGETFQEALDKIRNKPMEDNSQSEPIILTYPYMTQEQVQTLHAIEDAIELDERVEREKQVDKEAEENTRYHEEYEEMNAEYNKWQLEQRYDYDMDAYDYKQHRYIRSLKRDNGALKK